MLWKLFPRLRLRTLPTWLHYTAISRHGQLRQAKATPQRQYQRKPQTRSRTTLKRQHNEIWKLDMLRTTTTCYTPAGVILISHNRLAMACINVTCLLLSVFGVLVIWFPEFCAKLPRPHFGCHTRLLRELRTGVARRNRNKINSGARRNNKRRHARARRKSCGKNWFRRRQHKAFWLAAVLLGSTFVHTHTTSFTKKTST